MYISGSYFKNHCRYRIGDYLDARNSVPSFVVSEDHDNNYVFCKTEFLARLSDLSESLPSKFVLLTHNSDINICKDLSDHVLDESPQISLWYAQNMMCYNPKIRPLPIGLANPKWEHGNIARFKKISEEYIEKNNTVYVNFNVSTNYSHRIDCLNKINRSIDTIYPCFDSLEVHCEFVKNSQDEYLRSIARSLFVVSPMGNGADCHKTWESIYMCSVPIITDSPFARQLKKIGIPLVILNDWDDFKELDLSRQFFQDTWKDFDTDRMGFDLFVGEHS